MADGLVDEAIPERITKQQEAAPDMPVCDRRRGGAQALPCAVAVRIAPAGAVDAGEHGGVAAVVVPVGRLGWWKVAESVSGGDGVGARGWAVGFFWQG